MSVLAVGMVLHPQRWSHNCGTMAWRQMWEPEVGLCVQAWAAGSRSIDGGSRWSAMASADEGMGSLLLSFVFILNTFLDEGRWCFLFILCRIGIAVVHGGGLRWLHLWVRRIVYFLILPYSSYCFSIFYFFFFFWWDKR